MPAKRSARPDFTYEDAYNGIVCGIDEVGRGPLAGPVVAAAVTLRRDQCPKDLLAEINDSKKLSAIKRERLFKAINEYAYVSLSEVCAEEIDRINILQATFLAMQRAHSSLHKLMGKTPPIAALVDGNQRPKLLHEVSIQTIVKGDAKSLSIAAASIIAKHHRDVLMITLAEKFPQYGWQTNAGYGTQEHLEALEKHGITPYHRRSFAPVSKQSVKVNSANY
ncbi:MAG: ribonuclease HII [Micavibrio sp.]|nr:ribonuclease HII [Micavibrio sp.]